MKSKKVKGLLLIVVAIIVIIGCVNVTGMEDKSHASKVNTERLLECKDSYVGDNSKVHSIITNLPANEYSRGLELQTENKPYGINVKYNNFKNVGVKFQDGTLISDSFGEVLKKNAIVLFSLVKNVDVVTFSIDNELEYTYKRDELGKTNNELQDIVKSDSNLIEFLKGDMK